MFNGIFYFIKKISFCLVLMCFFLVGIIHPAWAHRPHDVVSQLEISPEFNQDQTLFIVVRNNLFKSKDGGQKFTRVFNGLDNQNELGSLAISPQNPNTLLIAAGKDGIYKSKDSGGSWVKINNGLIDSSIDLIKISPYSNSTFLAADLKQGLFLTQDSGENWSQVIKNKKITAIAFSPEDENKILIADDIGSLYFSKDKGESWERFSSLKNQGLISVIAFSPNFKVDQTVVVGTTTNGVFKSTDGGISFTAINTGITDQRIRDMAVVLTPQKKLELFASTWSESVFRSMDGGKNWSYFKKGLTTDIQADQYKVPHFNRVIASNDFNRDQTLFISGFDGLFKSINGGKDWEELETLSRGTITSLAISPNYENDSSLAIVTYVGHIILSRDQGKTWKSFDKGLEVPRFIGSFEIPYQDPRRFFDVAYSPNYEADKTMFASILWTQALRSIDQGESWSHINLPSFKGNLIRGLTLVPSPDFENDKTFFIATQYGSIYLSTDKGQNFSVISTLKFRKSNFPISLVISPNFAVDKTLYAANTGGVYQSLDGGFNWQSIAQDSPLARKGSVQLAISPNYQADKTLFAGTNEGLFITQDGGKSWSEIQSSAFGQSTHFEGVAISPDFKNDQTIIVSTRGRGLFKSVNGGKSFAKIGNNLIQFSKINDIPSAGIPIAFSPSYAIDKTLYGFGSATTEVFKSIDGGYNWQVITIPAEEVRYSNHNNYDPLTYFSLWLSINRTKVLAIILSLIAALMSYYLVGYLHLHKKIPLRKVLIRAITAGLVFILALLVFSTVFHVKFFDSDGNNAIVKDYS